MVEPVQAEVLARIADWETAWMAGAAETRRRDLIEVGPFQVLVSGESHDPNESVGVPVQPIEGRARAVQALTDLGEAFRLARRRGTIEFNEAAYPDLRAAADHLGMVPVWRHALMACGRAELRRFSEPDVAVRFLHIDDPDGDLDAFASVRRTGFGETRRSSTADEIATLRRMLERRQSFFALGRLEGVPAATGLITPIDGVGEIAGVVTLAEHRRRGVASSLTSFLVQHLFDSGGSLAWLDAADARAVALYRRLGFFALGDRLSYFVG